MRDVKRRGEDPREFRRLQCDLIAIFQPHDAESKQTVELMAWTWWQKARRKRGWTGPEPVQSADLDQRLEELLLLLVESLRSRHEWWQVRLASVLGWPVGSPANALRRIESRLFIFGAQPGRRSYPNESRSAYLLKRLQEEAGRIAAEKASQSGAGPGTGAAPPGDASGSAPWREPATCSAGARPATLNSPTSSDPGGAGKASIGPPIGPGGESKPKQTQTG